MRVWRTTAKVCVTAQAHPVDWCDHDRSYKKTVYDVRESPAAEIMGLLRERGARLSYSDPHVPVFPKMREHQFDLKRTPIDAEILKQQDCVVLVTDHDAFDYDLIAAHSKLLVDTRGRYLKPLSNVVATRAGPRFEGRGLSKSEDSGRRTHDAVKASAQCEKGRAEGKAPSELRRPEPSSVADFFRCSHGRPSATHQTGMQNTELGDLSVRRSRRHPEPVFVERQFEGGCEIEFRGIAQSRNEVSVAVGRGDDEFPGIELVHLLTCAVSHLHPGGRRLFPHLKYQSRPRLWSGLQ